MALIYLIENTADGKRYVGQIKKPGKTEADRLAEHFNRSDNLKFQGYLQRAIRAHGKDSFKISVIEECAKDDTDDREKFWIDKLKPEYNMTEGGEGGSTTHTRSWYNDGTKNLYIIHGDPVPAGFLKGRICKFNDPAFQKEMASRVDRKKRGASIKRAWDEGRFNRDHSKCGLKGDQNVAKRPEVRTKISKAMIGKPWSEERKLAKSSSMKGKKFPKKSNND